MKQLLTLLLIVLFTSPALSQLPNTIQIKGSIRDKDTKTWIPDVSIICLYAKDSSRISLKFSGPKGDFIFDNLPKQNLILHISYMGYKSLLLNAKISAENPYIDMGVIDLQKIGLSLNEVEIIKIKPQVKIMKDTIEFNSSNFKVKNNALAEDLFKKIPGVSIDQDGTIRINGEAVKSIMINGRLMLGNGDPKILSKNLQADLIDKIQLINKTEAKTMNDGKSDKIINITIKKNKQNLFSGEIGAALGTSNRFSVKTNLSRFSEHQQILLMINGDNVNGLTDTRSIGGGNLTRSWNIGGGYIADLNKKTNVNLSYMMDDKRIMSEQNNSRQSFIGDSTLFNNQQSKSIMHTVNYALYFQVEHKVDSLQKITFSNQISLSSTNDLSSNNYESSVNTKRIINRGVVSNDNKINLYSTSIGVTYEKKFRKKDRILSVWLNYSKGENIESRYNLSMNSYFLNNGIKMSDTINQLLSIKNKNQQVFLMIHYTEPIAKGGFLTFSFGEDQTIGVSDKSAYNYNIENGLYDKHNDTLSNKFRNVPIQHYTRISWLLQKEKSDYTISFASLFFNLNNKNLSSNQDLPFRSRILIPTANFNFYLTNSTRIRLNYIKDIQFPDIIQLQPIQDISDPLKVRIGNPELKPMTSHNISVDYTTLSATTMRSFSLSIIGKILNNQIMNDSRIDSVGRQEIKPSNHSGGYRINFNILSGFPFKEKSNAINTSTQFSLEKTLNYVNETKNINTSQTITQTISYNSQSLKLLDYNISGNVTYNKINYSNSTINNASYVNFGITSTTNINLPLSITIGTFLNYRYTSGLMPGYNNSIWILNTSISKGLFAHNQGLLMLQAIDLFNQNKSINRNIGIDYIEDTRNNVLGSFFMLRFSYFLGKGNKSKN
jgi:hypothetical protein